jgi:hypothetical protein
MNKLHVSDTKNSGQPDPKSRKSEEDEQEEEETLDQTIADSFPASDPPSSIPDPDHEENVA